MKIVKTKCQYIVIVYEKVEKYLKRVIPFVGVFLILYVDDFRSKCSEARLTVKLGRFRTTPNSTSINIVTMLGKLKSRKNYSWFAFTTAPKNRIHTCVVFREV